MQPIAKTEKALRAVQRIEKDIVQVLQHAEQVHEAA